MITNKIIFLKSKANLDKLLSEVAPGNSPVIFIEDTREIYTCGAFFGADSVDVNLSETDGKVILSIGGETIKFTTSGAISIEKTSDGSINFSSSALSSIKTETDDVLVWDSTNKTLKHRDSGVTAGSYGQSTTVGDVSTVVIPRITVDSKGHITHVEANNVSIRDYVKQKAADSENANRPILSASSDDSETVTGEVNKSNGLTYNNKTGVLNVKGGITIKGDVGENQEAVVIDSAGNLHIKGDIIVSGVLQGSATGTAVPKVHTSKDPQYGGASKNLYGHVKLKDDFDRDESGIIIAPSASSDNDNVDSEDTVAFAASPLMVFKAIEEAKKAAASGGIVITAHDNQGVLRPNLTTVNFSQDFEIDDSGNLSLAWYDL
jgi:hypothetical protein